MKQHRIVALGDSTTAGTPGFLSPLEHPPDGKGDVTSQYAYWLAREHPEWEVLNRGVNGQRSDEIRARFERDVTANKPSAVVILAGVNDIYQGHPIERVQQNLLAMYARAHELGIVAVACSVIPYDTARPEENQAIHRLNDWLRELGSVPFCDTHRAVEDVRDHDHLRQSPDGLHPTPSGYHRMAVALKPVLQKVLS
ncbi:MAG: GDSL-type esterase/lipase family protein [Candidatus Eremiobacterota bacterium]